MGVTLDEREMWFCRDCGGADDETIARLKHALRPPFEPESFLDDDHGACLAMLLPGACLSCGGGRMVLRLGKLEWWPRGR